MATKAKAKAGQAGRTANDDAKGIGASRESLDTEDRQRLGTEDDRREAENQSQARSQGQRQGQLEGHHQQAQNQEGGLEKYNAAISAIAIGTKKLIDEGGMQAAHAGPLASQLYCDVNGIKCQAAGK